MVAMHAQLLPELIERGYDVALAQRVYVEFQQPNGERRAFRPDITITYRAMRS